MATRTRSRAARRRLVRERSPVVLVMVDVINDLAFPAGPRFAAQLEPFVRSLAALKGAARRAGIPAIYVNDNFGRWRSDFQQIVAHCQRAGSRGAGMVRRLRPTRRDYFVLKPRHSGFHSTSLDTLLHYLDAHTVILTGLAGDNCVLFTAADAYMRDLVLHVPADCTLSADEADNATALQMMQSQLKADVTPSARLNLRRMRRDARARQRSGT